MAAPETDPSPLHGQLDSVVGLAVFVLLGGLPAVVYGVAAVALFVSKLSTQLPNSTALLHEILVLGVFVVMLLSASILGFLAVSRKRHPHQSPSLQHARLTKKR